jgi:NADPH:quinone reductase-like Zn-dependent oxidoreductase
LRVVRVPKFGVENLVVADADDPRPGGGEVLIATEAATINPSDAGIVTGAMASRFPPGLEPPYTPGWDCAGRVTAVGDGVNPSLIGQRVVGFSAWFLTGHGTQASMVALPATDVAVAPEGLAAAQLTTVGLNGLTAWRGLDELNLAPGETLAVTGAAGAVGGFALDLAVAKGLDVTAIVRERQRPEVLARGAAHAITPGSRGAGAAIREVIPGGVDAMLDTAGIGAPALGAIRDGGRYASVTVTPDPEREITVTRVYARMDPVALAALVQKASDGRLRTPVARQFDVSEAQAAYLEFSSGPHRGRIVLTF